MSVHVPLIGVLQHEQSGSLTGFCSCIAFVQSFMPARATSAALSTVLMPASSWVAAHAEPIGANANAKATRTARIGRKWIRRGSFNC